MLLARRRIERLVSDAGISDPSDAGRREPRERRRAAADRGTRGLRRPASDVIRVLDTLQDELKRRYREDPTLVSELNRVGAVPLVRVVRCGLTESIHTGRRRRL